MNPLRACLWIVLLVLGSGCGGKQNDHARKGPMDAPAYWVWHRSSPLTDGELRSLREAGVKRLYWQAFETGWDGKGWKSNRISSPQKAYEGLEVIPVFRLKPESAFLGAPDAPVLLARQVRLWLEGKVEPAEIQIDFDCPDRLLGNYAEFLTKLGVEVSPVKVSITALASWPGRADFGKLARSVVSLAPMFYDLDADAPADVMKGAYRAMADSPDAKWIQSWSSCPRKWVAGLANFERVSFFDENGRLIGHARGWTHDALFFRRGLRVESPGKGVTVFHADQAITVAGTRIPAGGRVVHRMPEMSSLRTLVNAADRAGASHVVYFALPGPGIEGAYTPGHLAQPEAPLRMTAEVDTEGCVRLKNQGPTDIPAGIWELELESGNAASFRSASPGEFAETFIEDDLPAEHAGRIRLRFSKIPAGHSLRSGRLVAQAAEVRWKVRGLTEMTSIIPADSSR